MSQPNLTPMTFATAVNPAPEFNFGQKRSSFNGNQPPPLSGLHASWPDGRQKNGGLGMGQPKAGLEGILKALNGTIQTKQAMPQGNRHTRRSLRARMKGHKRAGQRRRIKAGKVPQSASAEVMRSHAAQTAIQRYQDAPNLIDKIKPTFTAIASTLPNGNAPTDISMGWDGSLWAIDPQGSPHSYDPINNIWDAHGTGIDAATMVGDTLYLFRGPECLTATLSESQEGFFTAGKVMTIADAWPNLPRTFHLGVKAAANINGQLYLFKEGWYLPVGDPTQRAKLTDAKLWPADWGDGTLNTILALPGQSQLVLIRGTECVFLETADIQRPIILGTPFPVSKLSFDAYQDVPANIDAGFCWGGDYVYYFSGTEVYLSLPYGENKRQYIPSLFQNWPSAWNPVLQHAPSGRTGNLWVATSAGEVIHHDGEAWQPAPGEGSKGHSVSVGIDGSVWTAMPTFEAVYHDQEIGEFKFNSPPDQPHVGFSIGGFAFDYKGVGKLDHLVFYRPNGENDSPNDTNFAIIQHNNGVFESVFKDSKGPGGIPLDSSLLQAFACDLESTGLADHIVCYTPEARTITIVKFGSDGSQTIVWQSANGLSGFQNSVETVYDLADGRDLGFAFDASGTGKMDHLVFYRPGAGALAIAKFNGKDFEFVYFQGGGGGGIIAQDRNGQPAGYDLKNGTDRVIPFDYSGSGRLDHLVSYRPASGDVYIFQTNLVAADSSVEFTNVFSIGSGGQIGGYEITPNTVGMAYDYNQCGKPDHLVFYEPGQYNFTIIRNENGAFSKCFTSKGIGGYDLAVPEDRCLVFDYDGNTSGLVCFRPQVNNPTPPESPHLEAIWVIKNNGPALSYWDRSQWTRQQPPTEICQVSVGDATRVWLRDSNGNVLQYADQQYTPNSQKTKTAHISANNDGTVWHCDHSPNAFCLISESTTDSSQHVINPSVSSVLKVASTSYGASHCLTTHSDGSTVVYRYDSPYLFKTSKAYDLKGGLDVELGKLYLTLGSGSDPSSYDYQMVCLDSHTGEELASYSFAASHFPSPPVVDSARQLIYVTTYGWETSPSGCLLVFDAASLQLLCAYSTNTDFTAPPTLQGSSLFCVDNSGVLYKFDTSTFAAGASIQPVWSLLPPNLNGGGTCKGVTLAPLVLGDRVYVALLYDDKNHFLNHCKKADSSDQQLLPLTGAQSAISGFSGSRIVTNSKTPDTELELYIPKQGGVYIVRPFAPNQADQVKVFLLPNQTNITDITYDNGQLPGKAADPQLWFGDNLGNLWSIDPTTAMKTGNAPYRVILSSDTCKIETQPRLYQDPQGYLSVIFGLTGDTTNESNDEFRSLYILDVDSGTSSEIPTGVTSITAISPLDGSHNGVLYVAGQKTSDSTDLLPQVMGIRVDNLVQTQRNFIIESQLMQDYDPKYTTLNANGSNACYQTHLTVVDDCKVPLPNEAVKLWAEKPNTSITVDGVSYIVGPGDQEFASVRTGVDGTLTIISAAVLNNPNSGGTEKIGNIFAIALRAWASFMNPYERIVVNPDHEFHKRLITAYNNTSEPDPDPDKLNMAKVSDYSGKALFSDSAQQAGQSQSAADAVGQMRQGVGFGGDGTSTRLTYSHQTQGRRLAHHSAEAIMLAAAPQAYIAYPELTGIGYFATNIPSQRRTAPASTLGFRLSNPNSAHLSGNTVPFKPLTHSDALWEIDNLIGEPWTPPPTTQGGKLSASRRLGNWWTDFWDWLLGALNTVIHEIIVAIGEVVTVGIRLMVGGIEKVFHCQIKFLDDIASAIGSFFKMIETAIDLVIEALSVLLHFDKVLATQCLIRGYIVDNLVKLSDSVRNYAIPNVTEFFTQTKDDIKKAFGDGVKQAPTEPISQQQSVHTNSHAQYMVGPKNGTPSSHAVQCNWGIQKMKTGLSSATLAGDSHSLGAKAGDPVSDFFTNFINNTLSGGQLASDFSNLKSTVGSTFQASSASQFFQGAVSSFLALIEGLIEFILDIGKDLSLGLLGIFDDIIELLLGKDGTSGVMNTVIDIPVLSWLFKLLTNGQDLTLLNLFTLVAAIPVTVVCRVVQGVYPSKKFLDNSPITASSPLSVVTSPIGLEILGLTSAVLASIGGMLCAFSDSGASGKIVTVPYAVVSVLSIPLALPLISSEPKDISSADWISFGLGAALALLSILGLVSAEESVVDELSMFQSVLCCLLSILYLMVSVFYYINKHDASTKNILTLTQSVLSVFAGIINPIKFVLEEAKPVIVFLIVCDFVGPTTAGIIGTALLFMD